jgi:hypothetical protein
MPLPRLELKPGVSEMSWRGRGHDNICVLLRDLHEGVLELGIGNCEVLAHDAPQLVPAQFGFDLCNTDGGNNRFWSFMMTTEDFKRTCGPLPAALRGAMMGLGGRQRMAAMLQAGLSPEQIGECMGDPAIGLTGVIRDAEEDSRGATRALERLVIMKLGDESRDQDDDDDSVMVPVRWVSGVGFVKEV